MKIEERMTRRNSDDIIHVGTLIENVRKGEFWQVLSFVTASLRVSEIEKSKNGIGGPIVAERVLGRIEAYETVISELEALVLLKDELVRPVKKSKSAPDDGAEEIIDREEVEPSGLNYGGSV